VGGLLGGMGGKEGVGKRVGRTENRKGRRRHQCVIQESVGDLLRCAELWARFLEWVFKKKGGVGYN